MRISDFFRSGGRFAPSQKDFVISEEKHMRRISGFLAPYSLALLLLACAAIAGCSAHAGVHVDNPNHYDNHFNDNGGYSQHNDGPVYSK
jgi:hypothetical protein